MTGNWLPFLGASDRRSDLNTRALVTALAR